MKKGVKAFALLFALVACSGCGLWDVIVDINSEIGFSEEEFAKSKPKVEEANPPDTPSAGQQLQQRTAEWWGKAKSLGPRTDSGPSAMVRCRVAGSERFTKAQDCVSMGGTIVP